MTINSLFYNINTSQIEDLTRKGLKDLECGLIRTPLDPQTTFLDDPLRVLRSIRFASRFHFLLQKELCEAALSVNVQSALAKKVSRERIGKELAGMMTTNNLNEHLVSLPFSEFSSTEKWNPLYAFLLIHALQLHGVIFKFPDTPKLYKAPSFLEFRLAVDTSEQFSCEEIENHFRSHSLVNLTRFQRFIFYGIIANSSSELGIPELKDYLKELNNFEKRAILLASYFNSLAKIMYTAGKAIPGTIMKSIPVIKYIISDSLKHPNQEADLVYSYIENAHEIYSFLQTHKSLDFSRKEAGSIFCEEN